MPVTTQLIGKTSAVKGGLFRIKQRLLLLGFIVKNPTANSVTNVDGKNYVYDPSLWTEYDSSLDMAENIRDNDLHIVSNDIGGIVGKQAAHSIVLAISYGKPVIITHKPYFRGNVDHRLVEIINRNAKHLNFQNLLKLSNTDLKPFIELVAAQKPTYKLTKQERVWVKRFTRDLLREVLRNPHIPY